MSEIEISVNVYIARGLPDKEARPLCLRALVRDLVSSQAKRLVLERDQSLEVVDRRIIAQSLTDLGARGALSYDHEDAHSEELLWVSDAVAWAYQAGGEWTRRAEALTVGVIRLT